MMAGARVPRTLRVGGAAVKAAIEENPGKLSAVAGLIAVASFSGAEAQTPTIPPVNVDAPVARPRPAASKPTADQVRARNALRRAAQPAGDRRRPVSPRVPPIKTRTRTRRRPTRPIMFSRGKFPEKIVNTPKSITVLTKEVLEDKNATR